MNSGTTKKPITVLIVDNDPVTRDELKSHLQPLGFQFIETDGVEKAKEILKTSDVGLVIFELRLPNESGLALAQWVRRMYDTSFRHNMPLPLLLLTGFSHLLKKEDLTDYYLNGFLTKPFEQEELVLAVNEALGLKETKQEIKLPEQEDQEEKRQLSEKYEESRDYCRVVLADFISQDILEVDLFVKLSSQKFVKIARKGDQVNDLQFSRYKEKGINFIYTRKEDYKKLLDFNLKLNKAVFQSKQLDLDTKKKFMAKTGEMIMEHTFVNGVNEDTFNDAKEYLMDSIQTLLKDEEGAHLLDILNNHSDYLYAHSLGVSLYSVMIAQTLGWSSGANLFKLCYGGLMHDIGKKDFSLELLTKPTSDMSFEEKMQIETHAEKGKEILENLKTIPSDVIAIAYEHHENILGQGFPRFLHKNYINPMARIVAVADEFCKFAIHNPNSPGASAGTAIHLITEYKEKFLDPTPLSALRKLVREQSKKVS